MQKRTRLGLTWGIPALVILFFILSFNGLVSSSNKVDNKFAQIDTQLQRRQDLIPNLVQTVKGYAGHEKQIFTDLAEARSKLAGANTPEEKSSANNELQGTLSRLLVVVENYPNLKADKQYTRLMDELSGTENRIAVARKDYNDAVTAYNTKIKKFPTLFLASIFGFEQKGFFKADPSSGQVPKVDL